MPIHELQIPLFVNSGQSEPGSAPGDFRIKFTPALVVSDIDYPSGTTYSLAVASVSGHYSWHNISSIYDNNKISYSHDNKATAIIRL